MAEPFDDPEVAADHRAPAGDDVIEYRMEITDVQLGEPTAEGFVPVVQETTRGPIEMRYYPVDGATCGAIFVGGAGGGFDTPVRGWLYPRLCEQLQSDGIACLRVRYREHNELEECVMDVLAAISFLEADDVERIALVGHSFGGAVVIQAAALSESVHTCVPLSTQTYGADVVGQLGPRCSVLIAHGLEDEVLPPEGSRAVYRAANEPKRLMLKEGAHHGLDEWADELPDAIRQWIRNELTNDHGHNHGGNS